MATVVANLSSDMLLHPADSLTKGGLLLSRQQGARWGNIACGVPCGGYYVGVIMGEAEPSYPSVMADWQARRGRRQQLHYLGNTRSIVPPGQRIASASATSMRTSTYHNECSGGRGLLWRPSGLVYVSVLVGTCRLRTTPRRASTSSLSEGSGY